VLVILNIKFDMPKDKQDKALLAPLKGFFTYLLYKEKNGF